MKNQTVTAGIIAIVASLLVAFTIYYWQRERLLVSASDTVQAKAEDAAVTVSHFIDMTRRIPSALHHARLDLLSREEAERTFFAVVASPVMDDPQITGVFLGFPSGAFWQVTDLTPQALDIADRIRLPTGTEIRRIIDPALIGGAGQWLLPRPGGAGWSVRSDTSGYDPRTRPWFRAAMKSGIAQWTAPYRFASSGRDGITFSVPLRTASGAIWAVIGIDMTLDNLREGLERTVRSMLPDGSAVAVVGRGDRMGTPMLSGYASPTMTSDWRAILQGLDANASTPPQSDGDGHIVALAPIASDVSFPYSLALLYPTNEVIGPADTQLRLSLLLLATASAVLTVVIMHTFRLRREVTARRAAENGLRDANTALAQARDEAEAATHAKSSFLAMMSHEIRTPMNGVMAMAEMLDQTDLTEDQRDMSSVIRGSAGALLTIINDILDFSKIEAGKLDLEDIPFDPTDVLEAVGDLLVTKAEEKGIVLSVEAAPTLPALLRGDPTRLRQILLNLGGNAVKFTEDGGVIVRLTARATDEGERPVWRFEVVDTGIGLTDEQKGRLFKAFQQADSSTTRRFGGTGLGLAICQRLIDMMGGRIGVDSVPGEGSTFWFEVPLDIEDASPRRPAVPIDDVSVLLLDLHPLRRAAMQGHLEAADVTNHRFRGSEGLTAGELAGMAPTLVIVGVEQDSEHAFALHQALAREVPGPRWAIACSRRLVSTLGVAGEEGFFARLVHPIRRDRLWNVVGAAAGLVPLDERRGGPQDEFSGWQAPPMEIAEAENALILVAEDNETNQTVIRRILSDMGFAHRIVDNGRLALDALAERHFSLLLTDFHMPQMDGFQLTATVRAQESVSGGERLPIVALTADALPGTERRCRDLGMDGYLTKPIERRKLAAEVARLVPAAMALRQRATASPVSSVPRGSRGAATGVEVEDIDSAIFDVERLRDTFGDLGHDARAFLAGFLGKADAMAEAVETALEKGDLTDARDAAHALKGAARSLGAVRLGELASDIQDSADANDAETATFLASMLSMTVTELKNTVTPLLSPPSE